MVVTPCEEALSGICFYTEQWLNKFEHRSTGQYPAAYSSNVSLIQQVVVDPMDQE
jgi:hypothetical protein